jgi:hypothetical protein
MEEETGTIGRSMGSNGSQIERLQGRKERGRRLQLRKLGVAQREMAVIDNDGFNVAQRMQ